MPALPPEELINAPAGESTAAMRERIMQAASRAFARQGCANQRLQGRDIDQHARLDDAAARFLQAAAGKLGWSARSTHRALKVARTIADLAACEQISAAHIAEAMQYRRGLSGMR